MINQVKLCKKQLGTRFRDKDFLIKTCCFLLNFTASEGHFRELPGGKMAKTQFGTRTPNFRDKDPEISGQGPPKFGTRTFRGSKMRSTFAPLGTALSISCRVLDMP